MKYDSCCGSTFCCLNDNGDKETIPFASGCTVTIDGKLSSFGGLCEGDELVITGNPATAVVVNHVEAKPAPKPAPKPVPKPAPPPGPKPQPLGDSEDDEEPHKPRKRANH